MSPSWHRMLGTRTRAVVSNRSRFRRDAGAGAVATEGRPFADDSARGPAYAVVRPQSNRWSAMVLNPESKYPNRRAYVLKLRGDATPDALAGRIENLVTGQPAGVRVRPRVARSSVVRDLELRARRAPQAPDAAAGEGAHADRTRDATLTTSRARRPTLTTPSNPDESTPCCLLPSPPSLSADDADKLFRRADRLTGLVVAAALAASIALVLTGCSTPVSKPAVDVPAKFAARRGLRGGARGRLVGELPRPGADRPGAPRRAREPRRQDRRRAPARRACRRDGQPLLPDAQRQRRRLGQRPQQRLQRRREAGPAGHQDAPAPASTCRGRST